MVILALVSFFLGVVATTFWFRFSSGSNPGNSSIQTTAEPASDEPAAPTVTPNPPARPVVASHPPVDAAVIEEVKQAIPNFVSVPLADGEQTLREAALKQFTAAAKEMDIQVKQAQQQFVQAETDQSATEQQAARKHLQQTQAEETEKLQEIAAHLQNQIAALEQLKGTTQ